jgi:hypothetical protein
MTDNDFVSYEVDWKLSERLGYKVRIHPNENGDVLEG